MLGLVLVYDEVNVEGQLVAPDRDFLGAAVLARSLIAAIPADSEVKVVVAVAEKYADRVQADVIRRFGFIEVAKLLPWQGDLAAILRQSLEIFGTDCQQILLHDGRRPLLTQEHVKNILLASKESGAAVSVFEHAGPQIVLDSEGRPHSPQQRTLQVLHPQALSREGLQTILQQHDKLPDGLNLLPVLEETSVVALPADRDNLRILDERDLSRAVEVWSRRAVEFPFLWPRPERFDAHQRELEADKSVSVPDNEEQDQARDAEQLDQDPSRSNAMNAMLSGDSAAETTPLDAAFADMDPADDDDDN